MFGYIVPRKPELRVKEYNLYKSVYCTLCRELNDSYGISARILVNYDFVFLSLLGMALDEQISGFFEGRCNTNPLRRQVFVKDGGRIRYSAGCLILTAYYKFSDDIADERSFKKIKSFFLRLLLRRPYRKAAKAFPAIEEQIRSGMEAQKKAERENAAGYDTASNASAAALSAIFDGLAESETEKRVLRRMGYLTGRFVYLADAGDDLRDDIAAGRYNPAAIRHALAGRGQNNPPADGAIVSAIEEIREELLLTRGELAICYNLLDIRKYKEILDNIIFLGTEDTIAAIGTEKKGIFFNDRSL